MSDIKVKIIEVISRVLSMGTELYGSSTQQSNKQYVWKQPLLNFRKILNEFSLHNFD